MDRIKEIFLEHSQRYGYRRIYGQLRREDYEVNHKKVQRLMQKMGLFAISIRKKRKYSSYYGVQGKIARLNQAQFLRNYSQQTLVYRRDWIPS